MAVQSAHNLRRPQTQEPRPYGLRVSLKPNDPFRRILGPDWQRLHWFASPQEREAALLEMGRKHEYSRGQDKPALVFTKVEKLSESRGL